MTIKTFITQNQLDAAQAKLVETNELRRALLAAGISIDVDADEHGISLSALATAAANNGYAIPYIFDVREVADEYPWVPAADRDIIIDVAADFMGGNGNVSEAASYALDAALVENDIPTSIVDLENSVSWTAPDGLVWNADDNGMLYCSDGRRYEQDDCGRGWKLVTDATVSDVP